MGIKLADGTFLQLYVKRTSRRQKFVFCSVVLIVWAIIISIVF